MRSALQDALSAIPSRDGLILGAVYTSEDRSRFDVENVLIYNVGARKWPAARAGLRFERAFECPPTPPGDRTGLDHYHRYELTSTEEGWRHWDRGQVLGRFEIAGLGPRPHRAGPSLCDVAERIAGRLGVPAEDIAEDA